MAKQPKLKNKNTAKVIVGIVIIGALGVAIGAGAFFANKWQKENQDVTTEITKSDASTATETSSTESLDAMSEEEIAALKENFTQESAPQTGNYEDSDEAKQIAKEITEADQEKLRKEVGEDGYVNKAYGYGFKKPESWFEDPINSDISPFIYFTTYKPEEEQLTSQPPGAKIEVIVQTNKKNQSLDEWVEEGHTYMELKSSERIKIGEYEAVKEEVDYQGLMTTITLLKDGDVYTFAIYGEESEYQKQKETFEQMVESLVVL